MVDSVIIGLVLVAWFALLALAELLAARRFHRAERSSDARLVTNFGLGTAVLACNSLAPLAKIGSSTLGKAFRAGLWPTMSWPMALAALLLVESLAGYWTHRMMHAVPLLWRVHRIHHADTAVDISTSLRHHPLELLVTVPAAAAAIMLIGAPPSAVVVAQTIVFAAAIGQHASVDLPPWLDRALAQVFVTPAFHRLHHSPDRALHDGNYGDLITLWDRLFGTANFSLARRAVGLDAQAVRPERLLAQLVWPFYAADPARSLKSL